MATIKCSVCGSTDVQMKMWVKPNENNDTTTDFVDEILSNKDECWCRDCDDNVTLISEEDTNG